jgi:hypothetical protein
MYVLRKLIEHRMRTTGLTEDDCYICSLSSRTIVYKGQLTPEQVGCWVLGAGCWVLGAGRPASQLSFAGTVQSTQTAYTTTAACATLREWVTKFSRGRWQSAG